MFSTSISTMIIINQICFIVRNITIVWMEGIVVDFMSG